MHRRHSPFAEVFPDGCFAKPISVEQEPGDVSGCLARNETSFNQKFNALVDVSGKL